MTRRSLRAGLVGLVASLITVTAAGIAHADPVPASPGTPPVGFDEAHIYTAEGADAFAELTNYLTTLYNATTPAKVLASYDAVNPVTGAAGESINLKPGCTSPRINGANGGITAILQDQHSTAGDGSAFCIDWVRASRAKSATSNGGAEVAGLDFYAQSRDAVGYAVLGNAYAPTTPLTKGQLKDIFECTDTDWSQVGGQAGPIHVYVPPDTAATWTFFLTAIGSSVGAVNTGCGTAPTGAPGTPNGTVDSPGRRFLNQQNDGRTLYGDPQGIAPYAITKWAAQSNAAPGIPDWRGGTHIGYISTTTAPTIKRTIPGDDTDRLYQVLNPDFATGDSAPFGRIFFNTVRHGLASNDPLRDVFKAGGFLCLQQNEILIPFGNTPLGSDTSAANYCGKVS
ncbi:MAG: hypothetical protein JWR83_2736 [Aeromicrobium sp.]|nr:hypothetical protein [Aeromicrobium sp.]